MPRRVWPIWWRGYYTVSVKHLDYGEVFGIVVSERPIKEIEYQFSPMETDESVWRLHPVSEPMQTVALMVIYVDDVLFLGEEEIIMVMYKWITEGEGGWKCSPLEMVTQKAVRYLGMEMGYTMDLLRQYEGHHLVSSAVPVTRDTRKPRG